VRLIGRYQVPGCCPGTKAGRPPGRCCSGGGCLPARAARRLESRQLKRDILEGLDDARDLDERLLVRLCR
jgi:hypothetical protein